MRRVLIGLVCIAALACSDDDGSAPEPIQIPGSYALQTVNGQPLPFQLGFILNAYSLLQRGGTITLNPNMTYREVNDFREIFNDAEQGLITNDFSVALEGVWESQDSAVLLTETARGLSSFGYVSGDRLTLSFEVEDSLFTFVYRRN